MSNPPDPESSPDLAARQGSASPSPTTPNSVLMDLESDRDSSSMASFLGLLDHADIRGEVGSRSTLSTISTPELPETFDHFQLIQKLGTGTFGQVSLARDNRTHREVAIKSPTYRVLNDPQLLKRYLDEPRKQIQVQHKNVVQMIEMGEASEIPYFVMEYCEGGSLADWLIQARPVSVREGARLIKEVAEGVHEAHRCGLWHRDLKPGNILLAPIGQGNRDDLRCYTAKVADFGLAKWLNNRATALDPTASSALIGTIAYMPPERFQLTRGPGNPESESSSDSDTGRRVSESSATLSDVYSLGIVLYELLAGQRLYRADSYEQTIAQILATVRAPSVRDVRPEVPRELDRIVRTCLDPDPLGRYPTAAALADDLGRFDKGEPPRGVSWRQRIQVQVRRRKRTVAVGALVLLLGVGIAWNFETSARNNAQVWTNRVKAASMQELIPLLAEPRPPHRLILPELEAMFARGTPDEARNAALILAGERTDCADHAIKLLRTCEPNEIRTFATLLGTEVTNFVQRLVRELEPEPMPPGVVLSPEKLTPIKERSDRRIGNAAAALFLLEHPELVFPKLRFSADPQTRSFVIHTLGAVVLAPRHLLTPIEKETDPGIRAGLILALGEIPATVWTPEDRNQALDLLFPIYENEPDPGLHGAAKWFILRQARTNQDIRQRLQGTDKHLSKRPIDGLRGWRINEFGMTMIRVDLPQFGRVIEVADSETSISQFRRVVEKDETPKPDSPFPMTKVLPAECMSFCGLLTSAEFPKIEPSIEFSPLAENRAKFVEGWQEKSGYRPLTFDEFKAAAHPGHDEGQFPGTSTHFLDRYICYTSNPDQLKRVAPVASLQPNHLGFFDLFGNVWDLTVNPDARVLDFMFDYHGGEHGLTKDLLAMEHPWRPGIVTDKVVLRDAGFRVARTIKVLKSADQK